LVALGVSNTILLELDLALAKCFVVLGVLVAGGAHVDEMFLSANRTAMLYHVCMYYLRAIIHCDKAWRG
jgi:hypothetical protein